MLIRLVVSNFLSFKEETEFNMLVGDQRTLDWHMYNVGDFEITKAAAIYGANGSGKSNFIKAIEYLFKILKSGKIEKYSKYKLDKEYFKSDTSIEIEVLSNKSIYNYGIVFNSEGIVEEWLIKKANNNLNKRIFDRKIKQGKTSIKLGTSATSKSREAINSLAEYFIKPNELAIVAISNIKNVSIKHISNFLEWFAMSVVVNNDTLSNFGASIRAMHGVHKALQSLEKFTSETIKKLDTGIDCIKTYEYEIETFFGSNEQNIAKNAIEQLKNSEDEFFLFSYKNNDYILTEKDNKYYVIEFLSSHIDALGDPIDFKFYEESDGTKKLLDLIPLIGGMYFVPGTVFIDEIDRSIHPYLLKKLIKIFMEDKTTAGQVVFTTHESNLLDQEIFRRDEIWFTEKNKEGATKMYPLSDFDIRIDLDIKKGYLNGRFGAIPFLGNFNTLNWK